MISGYDYELKQMENQLQGIKKAIESLRALQEKWKHWRLWNHSDDKHLAPVELSDYLLIHCYEPLEKELKEFREDVG